VVLILEDLITKNLEIDLLASDRSTVGTYAVTVNAINLEGQVASLITSEFNCDGISTEECIRKFFIEKVNVVPDPTRNRAATVVNNTFTDNIEIKVPVVRKFVKFRAGRRNISVNATEGGINTDNGGTGGGVASFGETLDITRIRLGDSLADFANFRYDPTGGVNNGHFILSSGVNGNPAQDNFFFSDTGKLGIGVPAPSAFLDVRGGTTTMPQVRLNAGSLVTSLVNGALEFDGNELYLTKNGVREPLGSNITNIIVNNGSINSATFVNGDITKSTLTNNILKNNTVDGILTFTNNGRIQGDLFVNGMVTATKFMGDGSMLTNVAAAEKPALKVVNTRIDFHNGNSAGLNKLLYTGVVNFNTGAGYSAATRKFVAPVAGRYSFTASQTFTMNCTATNSLLTLVKNKSLATEETFSAARNQVTTGTCLSNQVVGTVQLDLGDTVEVYYSFVDPANNSEWGYYDPAGNFFTGFKI
jgi:hypothetical protein